MSDRLRPRQRRARVRGGIPYSNRESTLSLLVGAAIGEWLQANEHVVSGSLLDAGSGNTPYAIWYASLARESLAIDAAPGEGVGVVGFVDRLPLASGVFDTVLCTQVLEHVPDPATAAGELFRVTKPGGHALVTVPYLYPTHEAPHDYSRMTHHGLASVLAGAGYDVVEIQAMGGPFLLIAHFFVLGAVQSLQGLLRLFGLRRPLHEYILFRWLIGGPQEFVLRGIRVRRGVKGLASRVSLGYMALARRPP